MKEREDMKDVQEYQQMFAKQLTTVQRFSLDMRESDAITVLTAAYKAQVESRQRNFQEDDTIIRNIELVASWLAMKEKKPGLYLTGLCGTGKTTMIKAIDTVINWYYRNTQWAPTMTILKATEVAELAVKDLGKYKALSQRKLLAIDDLGQEPAVITNYGSVIKPCIDLLSERYDLQVTTFISSNLAPESIKEYYDERLADRFREMMEPIYFENNTFRR